MTPDLEARKYAAALIRRHFAGTVTPEVLLENFSDSSDPLIRFALDLVAHQPRRGFLGVREQHWQNVYWPRVEQVLGELDKGEAGKTPGARLYPVVTPIRLVGFFLLGLYVLGASADHALKVWKHVRGIKQLAEWQLFIDIAMSAFLAICALSVFRGFAYRLRLYRHRESGGSADAV